MNGLLKPKQELTPGENIPIGSEDTKNAILAAIKEILKTQPYSLGAKPLSSEEGKTDIYENVLLRNPYSRPSMPASVSTPYPNPATPAASAPPTNVSLEKSAPPSTKTETDYWSTPVFGRMPLDQFVQIAGALGGAFGTGPTGLQTPWARAGNVLAQIAGQAYQERKAREYEEPMNILRRRQLEKEIAKEEIPGEWESYYKEQKALGKPIEEIRRGFYQAKALPKAPKEYEPQRFVTPTGQITWIKPGETPPEGVVPWTEQAGKPVSDIGKLIEDRERLKERYGEDSSVIKAIDEEISKKSKAEERLPYPIGKRVRFIGKDGKEYEGAFLGLDANKRPQWGDVVKIAEKPSAGEKPEYTPKQAMARIAAINKAIATLKGSTAVDPESLRQFPWLAGINKVQNPEAVNQAVVSLEAERDEVIKYAPKEYRKKVAPPERRQIFTLPPGTTKGAPPTGVTTTTEELGKAAKEAVGKVVGGIKKRISGQVQPATVLPPGAKYIGKSKKTGNPVYQLPDGSKKEWRP